MAGIKATNSILLLDEFDLSCETVGWSMAAQAPVLDTTSICVTAATTSIPGLPSAELAMNGYFSATGSGYAETELRSMLTTSTAQYVAILVGTATTGCPAYVFPSGYTSDFNIDMPVDDIIALSGSFSSQTGFNAGLRIYSGTISTTGTQASVDFAEAGTGGGAGWLFVTAITGGATNATIDIESSANDSDFDSEGTFTFSAVGGFAMAMSGTVNRYLRINTTSMGTATDFTVYVVAAITGVPS